MTDRYADWDAAYVLGALDPRERREFAAHLAGCEACRNAVADLAVLPGLLASVPAPVVEPVSPADGDPTALDRQAVTAYGDVVPLARVAARARRSRLRRRAGLVVAASVVAVGGVFAGSALGPDLTRGPDLMPGPTTPSTSSSVSPVAQAVTLELSPLRAAGMRAHLVATPTPWGTRFEWDCRYDRPPGATSAPAAGYGGVDGGVPEPVTYELVLVDWAGARVVAATWTTAAQEAIGLQASSALPLGSLTRVEIGVAGRTEPLASATL